MGNVSRGWDGHGNLVPRVCKGSQSKTVSQKRRMPSEGLLEDNMAEEGISELGDASLGTQKRENREKNGGKHSI